MCSGEYTPHKMLSEKIFKYIYVRSNPKFEYKYTKNIVNIDMVNYYYFCLR